MAAEDRHQMSVALTCKDMSKSVAFYRDALGFAMKESWPSEDAPMWANMVLGGQSVMLGMAHDPDKVGEMCDNEAEAEYWKAASKEFRENPAGVGLQIYLQVEDVDAYGATIQDRGVKPLAEAKTQFYGIRELRADDPDGYHLVFFHPVAMESCQSCGMPLADAAPGQMYCGYCTDEKGRLKPYEQVFEGTVVGYFMGMQKMDRSAAEAAAEDHLGKMPAWVARKS